MATSISVPVQVSPSGSAGGGNVFEVGSLFGSSSNSAAEPNEENVPAAAQAVAGSVLPNQATGILAQYGIWILAGVAVIAILFFIKKFRK